MSLLTVIIALPSFKVSTLYVSLEFFSYHDYIVNIVTMTDKMLRVDARNALTSEFLYSWRLDGLNLVFSHL